jgi:hypothetical protein
MNQRFYFQDKDNEKYQVGFILDKWFWDAKALNFIWRWCFYFE